MTRLFIVGDENNARKALRLSASSDIILMLDGAEALRDDARNAKVCDDYIDKSFHSKSRKEALDAVRRWGNAKLGGEKLRDAMNIDGFPFWDFIESNLATTLSEITKKIQYMMIVKEAVSDTKPGTMSFAYDGSPLSEVCACVAKSFGIKTMKLSGGKNRAKARRRAEEVFYRMAFRSRRISRRKASSKPDLPGGRIMVYPSIQTMIPVIEPVFRKLGEDAFMLKYDMLKNRMSTDMERRELMHYDIESWWTDDMDRRSKSIKKRLRGVWRKMMSDKAFQSSLEYRGICMWDALEPELAFYLSTRFRLMEIAEYSLEMERIIEDTNPRLVIALDEFSETGLPLAFLARRSGIPLLILQHGFFGEGSFIYGPSLATKKAVWGPAIKRMLLKRRFTESQLVVTGCPKFDDMPKKASRNPPKRLYDELGLSPGERIVTLATQPNEYMPEVARMVFDALSGTKERLLLKLHPREMDSTFYSRTARDYGIDPVITRTADLYDVIGMSSAVMVMFSTVGLEVLMMGKPLIIINKTGRPLETPIAESGAPVVRNSDGLSKALRLVGEKSFMQTFEKKRKSFVRDQAYKMDGKATERVLKLIRNMTS